LQIVTATNIKNRLGDLFDAVERDEATSFLIERNHKPLAMLLNAHVAEKIILGAYARGVISRAVAMQQLGLDWYGELIGRMAELGIERPLVSADDGRTMETSMGAVFLEPTKPTKPATAVPRNRRT
jgi:hypothetical protein